MKSEKLYHVLKALLTECVDDMGLPQKPTIKALYKARDVVWKYEKEQKKREIDEAPILEPIVLKNIVLKPTEGVNDKDINQKLTVNYE